MPPRKYNQTRAACMFCEKEPCECGGPVRGKNRKVDLSLILNQPKQVAVVEEAPPLPGPVVPVVEEPVRQPRHSPGKLTSAKPQKVALPARSGLTKITREVVEEPVWQDDSIDNEHEVTWEQANRTLFESGLISIESMIENAGELGMPELEANKLIWRITRERGGN